MTKTHWGSLAPYFIVLFGLLARAIGEEEFNFEVPRLKDVGLKVMLCIEESPGGGVEKIYFYYVNGEGKRVVHGKMIEYFPGRGRAESLYDNGRFIERSSKVVYE